MKKQGLDEALLRSLLQQSIPQLEVLPETDSTNIRLSARARDGAPEWTLVVADSQTAGRGRYQRTWHSPAGKGLYFSLLLRPQFAPDNLNLINLLAASTLAGFLESKLSAAGHQEAVQLKWPNDVLVRGKKLAGILIEGSFSGKDTPSLILGMGVNINHQYSDLPDDIARGAVSLRLLTGRDWSREELLAGFVNLFYENFYAYFPHNPAGVVQLYSKKLLYSGRQILIVTHQQEWRGIFRRLTPEGYLVLEQDGKEQVVTTGELFVLDLPPAQKAAER